MIKKLTTLLFIFLFAAYSNVHGMRRTQALLNKPLTRSQIISDSKAFNDRLDRITTNVIIGHSKEKCKEELDLLNIEYSHKVMHELPILAATIESSNTKVNLCNATLVSAILVNILATESSIYSTTATLPICAVGLTYVAKTINTSIKARLLMSNAKSNLKKLENLKDKLTASAIATKQ